MNFAAHLITVTLEDSGTLAERMSKPFPWMLALSPADRTTCAQDLVATIRNQMVDAWDFLTRTPGTTTPTNYRMKGELSAVQRGGVAHQRWQHEPTLKGTAWIWFYVEGHVVHLEQVHTSHPSETKQLQGHRWPVPSFLTAPPPPLPDPAPAPRRPAGAVRLP